MSEQERRELDAWLAENAMEWNRVKEPGGDKCYAVFDAGVVIDRGTRKCWSPTRYPEDALEVLKKCGESQP